MTDENNTPSYRIAVLPQIGRVQVPAHMTDAEVLSAVLEVSETATAPQKTKKKPKIRR